MKLAALNGAPATMRVILFFARNPDEQLTTEDMHTKFGVGLGTAPRRLRNLIDSGYVRTERVDPKDRRRIVWVAGPTILKECGIAPARAL